MKITHKNRQARQQPKSGKIGWCRGCDRYIVSGQEKCPVCGGLNYKCRRFKKSAPTVEEFDQ